MRDFNPITLIVVAPNAQVGQRLKLQHNTAELTITQ